MSLDVTLTRKIEQQVYDSNITHNLADMAEAAGIYKALWRPEELGITKALELIPLLEIGLKKLKKSPKKYEKYNSSNGWGTYKYFVPFVENYLNACKENPDAFISVSR